MNGLRWTPKNKMENKNILNVNFTLTSLTLIQFAPRCVQETNSRFSISGTEKRMPHGWAVVGSCASCRCTYQLLVLNLNCLSKQRRYPPGNWEDTGVSGIFWGGQVSRMQRDFRIISPRHLCQAETFHSQTPLSDVTGWQTWLLQCHTMLLLLMRQHRRCT